jgi:hypothetical protein
MHNLVVELSYVVLRVPQYHPHGIYACWSFAVKGEQERGDHCHTHHIESLGNRLR